MLRKVTIIDIFTCKMFLKEYQDYLVKRLPVKINGLKKSYQLVIYQLRKEVIENLGLLIEANQTSFRDSFHLVNS